MSFQGNRGQVNKRFAGNLASQAAKSRGRGRGAPMNETWIEKNKDPQIPHYEDEPGWNRSQLEDGPEGGHFPRGRGRFMRWRGGRGNRGRGGGSLPCLGSSFVKEPMVPHLHSIPNIPMSVMNNQQQTYFNQQDAVGDGPPAGPVNGGGPEWGQHNGAGGGFVPSQHQMQQPPVSMQQHIPQLNLQQQQLMQHQEQHQHHVQMHNQQHQIQQQPHQQQQQQQQQQMHHHQQQQIPPPHQQMQHHLQQQQQQQQQQHHPQIITQQQQLHPHQQPPPQQAGPPPSQRSAEQFLQSQQEMLTVATQAARAINEGEGLPASSAQTSAPSQVSSSVTTAAATVAVTTTSLSTAPPTPMTEQERQEKMAADAVAEIANKYNSTCDALRHPPPSAPEDRMTVRQRKEAELQAAWDTLHQYWQFVQDNPYDFNGWTYLLSHVETMDNIDAARAAFDGFLPLYPYCFAYWRKISDMEAKHGSPERSLGILLEGVRCIPACTELWTAAMQALTAYSKEHEHSEDVIVSAIEECVDSVGLSYRGVEAWDYCVDYYTQRENLQKVVQVYRELLNTPTKQYNKHWDRFLALVRDHHPRSLLTPEEYENLRQSCCKQLGLKYTPGPLVPPAAVKKSTQPEDKVSAAIKEKLVASLVPMHEANEKAVNKRWKYEERIKRPYFHIKALDRRQIKNWNEYLELEIREGNPYRVVMLFERCLVACAQYEDVWCKYAEYLEEHVRNVKAGIYDEQQKTEQNSDVKNGKDLDNKNSDTSKNTASDKSDSVGVEVSATGVSKGDDGEAGTRKDGDQLSESCTGFASSAADAVPSEGRCVDGPESLVKEAANKATDQASNTASSNCAVSGPGQDLVQKEASSDKKADSSNVNSDVGGGRDSEHSTDSKSDGGVDNSNDKDNSNKDCDEAVLSKDQIKSEPLDDDIVCINEDSASNSQLINSDQITDSASAYLRSVGGDRSCWTYQDVRGYVSSGVGLVGRVLTCPPLTHKWVYHTVDWEDVRQVYRRAAWIHCPNKPLISMQWAYFEELQGNVGTARDLLSTVVAKHPTLLAARLAQVELEQRAGNLEHVEQLYRDALSAVISPRDRSFLAIKCARFLFKMRDNFDAALALLRKALKKDRCNVFLYQHVFDLCYERRPMDSRGVLAAVSLALLAKDLPLQDKCCFAVKKIAFLREHGTLEQLREARQELKKHEKLLEQSIKEEKEKEEKENAEKKKKEAEEKIKAAKEEVKKDDEKVMATAASLPPPSQQPPPQEQQAAPQGPQQQFPTPCFSADGVITYAPMEGYGYGVGGSDAPTQQQGPPPTAQLQQQRPPPGPYSEPPAAAWQPDMNPDDREMERQQQQNRQYEDMLRNRHLAGQGLNQQGGPSPNQGVDSRGLLPHPPQGGPNLPPLMPPPPFPNLQTFSGQGIPGSMGDPGNQPGFKRPFPPEFRDGEGSDAKQARLDLSSRHQGNLAQFDPHYTEQSGPAAPPSHRATFGSYGDGPMPFGRPGGLRNFMRGGPNDQPMRGGPNDQPMRGGPNDQSMRGGPNDQSMRGGPNDQSMRGGPNDQPMRVGPNDQPLRGGPNDPQLPTNGGPGAAPNRPHNDGLLPPQGRHPNGLPDFGGQPRPQGPPNDGPRGPFGPQNSGGPSEGQVIGPGGLQSLGVPRQLGLHEHSDTVNVPEWLVREGGELRLSATGAGNSVIRYWPSYMTVEGGQKMFDVIRTNTKWHQRRMLIDGEGVNVPHLLSWVGPCDYSYRGMTLYKNDTWRPEIVDLLHRLMQYTSTQYNSCYLSLYRNGSDHSAWACHDHPALRERPVVAIVSLGQTRHFEMQRKDGRGFLRFPLFSGSLLLMEGATQDDWIQQVPKQPQVNGERMELTFRKMFMIKGLTV